MIDDIPRPVVPPGHLEASTVFSFLQEDFAAIWDALVAREHSSDSGANFTLGLLASILIELCCRIAGSNPTAYDQFSRRLGEQESRYYSLLPFATKLPRKFKLPAREGAQPECQLLAAIFDLLRHGQAHQYQQMAATLNDGRLFGIQLTGAEAHAGAVPYDAVMSWPNTRPLDHLAVTVLPTGNIWLRVRPEILFKDVVLAARMAGLFSSILQLDYLKAPAYNSTGPELLEALDAGGHARI